MLRALHWPEDRLSLLALDGSFTTERIYTLEISLNSFFLKEIQASPPVHKKYPLPGDIDGLKTSDWAMVATNGDTVVGLVDLKFEKWNRRAIIRHLYVAASMRGKGIGRRLIDSSVLEAKDHNACCLWAETQTNNYAAIQFYKKMGFALCGLDTSLYDPDLIRDEVALFYSRTL